MAKAGSQPLVFISHVAEEKDVAIAFKELIDSVFHQTVRVFVSSSPDSIQLGTEWLDKIKTGLKTCEIEIAIVSPTSEKRPWINFEAGAVWSRDKPVVPLCHSGLTEESLGYPLKMLQAGTATNEDKLKEILALIMRSLGGRLPDAVDVSGFIRKVEEFEAASKDVQVQGRVSPIVANNGLAANELTMLVAIAEASDARGGMGTGRLSEVGRGAGVRPVNSSLAFRSLLGKGLLEETEVNEGYEYYDIIRLTPQGWEWLQNNSHLIDPENEPPPSYDPF